MADINATLQTLLGALVAGRCYPVINTANTVTSPYITFQLVYANQNLGTHEYDRYQIDVWATTFGAAKTLAGQVKAAMKAAAVSSFANEHIGNQDLYEEVSKEFRVMLEYYIWP
jgi:hypothetical protein